MFVISFNPNLENIRTQNKQEQHSPGLVFHKTEVNTVAFGGLSFPWTMPFSSFHAVSSLLPRGGSFIPAVVY